MKLEEFFTEEFRQDILAQAHADCSQAKTAFLEYVFKRMEEAGYPSFQLVEFKQTTRNNGHYAVDAWASDEEGRLILVFADFRNTETISSLAESQLREEFARIERFFVACQKKEYITQFEEASPAFPLARMIYERQHDIKAISFVVVSDGKLSQRIKTLPDTNLEGLRVMREVWDIERLWQLETSGAEREPMIVDFTADSKRGLPCLVVPASDSELQSLLIVFSGTLLANLYERYGERLLEQNVRTFLQFKGKVNKGIRDTIVKHPRMFFAYNNGICATAESIELSQDKNRLLKATNLQIVNGGQTTAAIYTANRKDRASISNVFVQAKLTVVDAAQVDEIVPNISKYANTQNKVSEADLASNSPFQFRVKELSEKIWAPSPNGGTMHTHWFYERARGQYVSVSSKKTPAEKRKFEQQNPKSQRFDKTDLAKAYLAFAGKPHWVCLGAQKAFAKFVADVAGQWNNDEAQYNDLWFKESVAKLLIFRSLDSKLRHEEWFRNFGSYKAQVIAYTLSLLSWVVDKSGKALRLEDEVWLKQSLATNVLDELVRLSEHVTSYLMSPLPNETTNISERAKKEIFWNGLKEASTTLSLNLDKFLIPSDEYQLRLRTAREDYIEKSGAEARKYVFEKGADYWCQLRDWDDDKHMLSPKERKVLDKACDIPQRGPNPKQSKLLKDADDKAVEEGFSVI